MILVRTSKETPSVARLKSRVGGSERRAIRKTLSFSREVDELKQPGHITNPKNMKINKALNIPFLYVVIF
jgi:hypothetical protein